MRVRESVEHETWDWLPVKVACSVVDNSKEESVVHESKRDGGACVWGLAPSQSSLLGGA